MKTWMKNVNNFQIVKVQATLLLKVLLIKTLCNHKNLVFYKVSVFETFEKLTGKLQCQSLFFNKLSDRRPQPCNFIIKETVAQLVSCEVLKSTFLTEQLRTTTSGYIKILTAAKLQYRS